MSIKQKIVCLLILVPYAAFAKSGSVNYSWGADALATMHDFVVTMMLYVLYICYSIASVLVIVSAFQIYIKMNTGEDGIVKSFYRCLARACSSSGPPSYFRHFRLSHIRLFNNPIHKY